MDESQIEIKKHFWKRSIELNWTDLTSVMFKPYEVIFLGKNTRVVLTYKGNADKSLEIKRAIRAFAEKKQIPVLGG